MAAPQNHRLERAFETAPEELDGNEVRALLEYALAQRHRAWARGDSLEDRRWKRTGWALCLFGVGMLAGAALVLAAEHELGALALVLGVLGFVAATLGGETPGQRRRRRRAQAEALAWHGRAVQVEAYLGKNAAAPR